MSTERIIRKLPARSSHALDERPGTVQLVLVVWAVLVTALIVLLGGFDDTRMLHNGWFRLATVAVTWGLLAWAAASPGKWMAQRLRLGVAASLSLHTLLALALVFANLTFLLTQPDPAIDRQTVVEPTEVPKLVEVSPPATEEQPLFEKPVPTSQLAQQQQPQSERAKVQMVEPMDQNLEPPELASSTAPQSLVERPPRTALTHRAKSPSQRSRQSEAATLATTLAKSIQRTDQQATASRSEPSPAAQMARAEVERETPSPTEPAIPVASSPPRVAARSNPDAPQVAQVQPAPRRRQSPAEVTEPAVAIVAPSLTTPETNRLAAEPTRLERPKAPVAELRDLPEPQQLRETIPSAIARRDTRSAELPLAASPVPLDRRQPVSVAQAVTLAPQSREVAEVTRTESPTERPQEPVAPSLRKPQLAAEAPRTAEHDDTESRVRTPPTPQSPQRRPTSLVADAPSATQSPRLLAEAAAAIAPDTPEPQVAAVPSEATREPSSSPAPRVLADSRGGSGTQGDGLNSIADAPAAPTYSAPFATAAATRPRSTQTERGPALAPNPVATMPRSRAAAPQPSSTLVAQPVPRAQVAGSMTPKATSASSSAAVEKQFANVALGDMTAAAGEAEFDTGPPQVTPERGAGRGAIGGRLAMRTPETRSGLGPRRLSQAAMSPSATRTDPAPPILPSAASPAAAAMAYSETRPGGAPSDTATGRPAEVSVPKLAQARAPAGAVSGGGVNPPSVGPPASAIQVGAAPPRAGGSIARTRAPSGRSMGPAIAAGPTASRSRSVAGAASPAATAAAVMDPVAVALVTPLSADLVRSPTATAPPATASASNVAPKRRTVMPAELGAGGIGGEPSLDPGVPQRIARRQTSTLRMTPGRFANRSEGGEPTPPGRRRNPAPAFAARTDRSDAAPLANPNDPSPKTEAAIELGLAFLAPLQQSDGRWSLSQFNDLPIDPAELPTMQADGAATGMALLAFLGGGYDHYDDKYQAVVERGLDYLISQQSDEGDIFPERDTSASKLRFYSHGIAALALSEAYGMTGDPELREPAQRALDYIARTQHPQLHGWRYVPGRDSDLSVAGWQVMALRSGDLAGLQVDGETYRRMALFLDRCRVRYKGGMLYCYDPYRSDVARFPKPSTVMTSVGALMELYLGETRESTRVQEGADHLAKNLPMHPDKYTWAELGTAGNPLRDTYYWYYATQVMFHMGGNHWQEWHEHLYPLLISHQTQEGPLAGSWNPRLPVPDRHGPLGGRLYVTCLNLLSLEVSYRHLPLYEMTGK